MKYRALVSFSGVLSLAAGEVAEISDPAIVADLLRAGYIAEHDKPAPEQKPKAAPKKKATKKGAK